MASAGAYTPEDADAIVGYHTSPDMVEETYALLNGRKANSGLANSIASHVAQGRGYFDAASGADSLVRPLLTYYGVLALSRALVLLKGTKGSESALSYGHGLSAQDWQGPIAAESLLDLKVQVVQGTFSELVSAIGTSEKVWVFTGPFPSRVRLEVPIQHPPGGSEFVLGQLLSRTPELAKAYERVTKRKSDLSQVIPFMVGQYHLLDLAAHSGEVAVESKREEASRSFWEQYGVTGISQAHQGTNYNFLAEGPYNSCRIQAEPGQIAAHMGFVEHSALGDIYMTRPLSFGRIHPLPRLFIVSFALGMLARYYPTVWRNMLYGKAGNKFNPLFQQAHALIEPEFVRWWSRLIEHPRDPWRP